MLRVFFVYFVLFFNVFHQSEELDNVRARRGLLDTVKIDLGEVDPVLNALLSSNTPAAKATSTTSTETPEVVPMCGRKLVQHSELIVSGQQTKAGDWPWHAALYRLQTAGATQEYICGGTLISPSRVLTGAHCVHVNNAVITPERLYVVLGKYNIAGGDMGSQEKSVFDVSVHPEFSRTNLANDLAILKLSSRAIYTNYVQPICLWNTNTNKAEIVDKLGTVVGWGLNAQDVVSPQLMRVDLPVIDDLECIQTNALFFSKFVTKKTFCAGHRNGTNVCNGDSGGGMYFSEPAPGGAETWHLRGVVSVGVSNPNTNTCDPYEYAVFTDAAQYLDYIISNLD